jgi:hypothetical protein
MRAGQFCPARRRLQRHLRAASAHARIVRHTRAAQGGPNEKELEVKRSLSSTSIRIIVATLAAVVYATAAALAARPAEAATSIGVDATHDFRIAQLWSGPLVNCTTDAFSNTGTASVGYPTLMKTPQAGWVYYTSVLEQSAGSTSVVYAQKQWTYNWASQSGSLYFPKWRELGTNSWLGSTLSFDNLPAGYYRMNLNFFWPSDSRYAVYQTDWCKIGR